MAVRWHVALGLAGSLALVGCTPEQVKQADRRPTVTLQASAQPTEPIALQRVLYNLQRGTRFGSYYSAPGCRGSSRGAIWEIAQAAPASAEVHGRFFEPMQAAGYRVVGDPKQIFDRESDRASARYLVGAQISEVQMNMCNSINFWTEQPYGPFGDAYVKVDWQVYSVREQRIVYETTTAGNGRTTSGTSNGIAVLIQEAFADAAGALAATPRFRELVSAAAGPSRSDPAAVTAAAPDLEIPTYARHQGPISSRPHAIVAAAVTILSGGGHGSGFFVSDDGLLLTNQHVVGNADQVNVRLTGGVEVVGRVLRRDAVRDVAAVKIDIARARPLPISTIVPAVGSDVYTLGSPTDPNLAGTLSRGIVSASRVFDRGGVPLAMIQSDAVIYGGNSGGPLLDASGNVVGIAVSGVVNRGQSTTLNFFIPIDDALRYLNIRLGQPRELRF